MVALPAHLGCNRTTGLDRLATLPDAGFISEWNAAGTTDEVVQQVVPRVGHIPRWAVVARAAVLRKAGADAKLFGPMSGSKPAA